MRLPPTTGIPPRLSPLAPRPSIRGTTLHDRRRHRCASCRRLDRRLRRSRFRRRHRSGRRAPKVRRRPGRTPSGRPPPSRARPAALASAADGPRRTPAPWPHHRASPIWARSRKPFRHSRFGIPRSTDRTAVGRCRTTSVADPVGRVDARPPIHTPGRTADTGWTCIVICGTSAAPQNSECVAVLPHHRHRRPRPRRVTRPTDAPSIDGQPKPPWSSAPTAVGQGACGYGLELVENCSCTPTSMISTPPGGSSTLLREGSRLSRFFPTPRPGRFRISN